MQRKTTSRVVQGWQQKSRMPAFLSCSDGQQQNRVLRRNCESNIPQTCASKDGIRHAECNARDRCRHARGRRARRRSFSSWRYQKARSCESKSIYYNSPVPNVLTTSSSFLVLLIQQYRSKSQEKTTLSAMLYGTSSTKIQMSNSAGTPYHIRRKPS